jgi:hypothetical protein
LELVGSSASRFPRGQRRLYQPPLGFNFLHELPGGFHGRALPGLFAKAEILNNRPPILLAVQGQEPLPLEHFSPVRKPYSLDWR